jgi:outer membrane protein assembly factor BamB
MKRGTLAVILLTVFVLSSFAVFGTMQILSEGGELTEQWVSETARGYQQNHHPITAATTDKGVIIVAPINDIGKTATNTSCALVRLNKSSGDVVWRSGLAPANCTTHSLPDATIAELDDDGTREILIARGDHTLTVYDAATGTIEWRYPTSYLGYSRPAVGNLLPAAGKEVVVVDLNGQLSVVHNGGSTAWQRNLSASTWASPFIADFDGDGASEIAVGTADGVSLFERDGERAWRTNGSVLWMVTAPVDTDPAPELIVANDIKQRVSAIDGATGRVIWSQPLESIPALHAVGDGDGDGMSEVYVGVSGGRVSALTVKNGTVEWTTDLTQDDRGVMPPPSLGDLDGDGTPKLVAVTPNGVVTVLDPNTGEQLATYKREVPIWIHPTLVDLDADGQKEILVLYGDGRVVALSYDSDNTL